MSYVIVSKHLFSREATVEFEVGLVWLQRKGQGLALESDVNVLTLAQSSLPSQSPSRR